MSRPILARRLLRPLRAGVRLLDLACGPGQLARRAVDLQAEVIAVDLSERMVALAGHAVPGLDVRLGCAEDLPLALAMWMPPPGNPLFAVLLGALGREGDLSVAGRLPQGEDMFAYADTTWASNALGHAGFSEITCAELVLRFPVVDLFGGLERLFRSASVRSRALFEAQTPEAQLAILATATQLADRLASKPDHDGIRYMPAVCTVIAARTGHHRARRPKHVDPLCTKSRQRPTLA